MKVIILAGGSGTRRAEYTETILEQATAAGELMAFCHEGFWHCMDTKRDRDEMENLWQSGDAPWVA